MMNSRSLSSAHRLPMPGPLFGKYPQRIALEAPSRIEKALVRLERSSFAGIKPLITKYAAAGSSQKKFVAGVREAARSLLALSSQDFALSLKKAKLALIKHAFEPKALTLGLAHSFVALKASLGVELYDTQIIGARIMLEQKLAEMATGEGKTYAMFAAAATAALAGVPVHVVTANAYLAKRDAEELSAAYKALGLSVCFLDSSVEPDKRVGHYQHDVVYGSASEFIFDYLLDRSASMPGRQTSMRGLCLALVDEADSVLIDEARTPFILAQERRDEHEAQAFSQAIQIARSMSKRFHFSINAVTREVHVTETGKAVASERGKAVGGLWAKHSAYREELVSLALAALHVYQRDVDYVVTPPSQANDNKAIVELIDINTGRIATGRKLSNGLHQLLEVKEACEVTSRQHTIAQLTFQRFFTRYHRLGGMSGTVDEAAREIKLVYGLGAQLVPLRKPSKREYLGTRIYCSPQARWSEATRSIQAGTKRGRPVLVGTDSVADSQRLSELLSKQGLAHQVLNASQSASEAQMVAAAGRTGQVTVATNMAGRGTDIKLDDIVKRAGGLHVVSCQLNSEKRIDRQLYGRCARQGDKGSVEAVLGLNEGLFARHLSPAFRSALARLANSQGALPTWVSVPLLRFVQGREQAMAVQQRKLLAKNDEQLERQMAVSGYGI